MRDRWSCSIGIRWARYARLYALGMFLVVSFTFLRDILRHGELLRWIEVALFYAGLFLAWLFVHRRRMIVSITPAQVSWQWKPLRRPRGSQVDRQIIVGVQSVCKGYKPLGRAGLKPLWYIDLKLSDGDAVAIPFAFLDEPTVAQAIASRLVGVLARSEGTGGYRDAAPSVVLLDPVPMPRPPTLFNSPRLHNFGIHFAAWVIGAIVAVLLALVAAAIFR